MELVFRCRKRTLPPGDHRGRLVGIDTVQSPLNRARDAMEFRLQNDNGEASRLTGTVMRVGESLHEFAEQLLGTAIGDDDEVDLGECIGRLYQITVVSNGTGGVAIECVKPISE